MSAAKQKKTPPPAAEPESADAGRPIGHDEIDPELVKLIKPRIRLGLVTSGAIVLFSIFLMVKLRHDLAFSRAGDAPRDITVADVAAGKVENESYVRVHAVPDRSLVGLIARSEADYGNRVAPAQGSAGSLWIVIDGTVWNAERSYQELYSGRLRRLAELPFADSLRTYVREHSPALRFVTGEALKAALLAPGGAAVSLTEPGGDVLPIGPSTIVEVTREDPHAVLVHAARTDRQPDEAAWRLALAAAELPVTTAAPEKRGERELDGWVFRVEKPDARADAEAARAKGALFGARVEAVIVNERAAWQTLRADAEALELRPATAGEPALRLPWSALEVAGVEAPRVVADDAMVLLTRESPDGYWYLLPVYVLLAAFALLFTWAFVRRLRDSLPAPAPAPTA